MSMASGRNLVCAIWLASSAVIAGCGPGVTHSSVDSLRSEHRQATGPITENIQRLHVDKSREECDRDAATVRQQLEMARAVDQRQTQIDKIAQNIPLSSQWQRVRLGPIFVRERVKAVKPEEGWTDYTISWRDIYKFYTKMKDQSVDADWITLNSLIRGIITNDVDRMAGANFYNDRTSGPSIAEALSSTQGCIDDSACLNLSFSAEIETFLRNNRYYRMWLTAIRDPNAAPQAKRSLISRFVTRLKNDYRKYEFRVNPAMERTSDSELWLPLVAGPFSEVTAQLGQYIESVWSSANLGIKIRWLEVTPDLPDLFRFVLEEGTGGRAFVSYTQKEIHLFTETKTTTIAHELGHVIGFPDYYYTVWHPESCEYIEQQRAEDLMSSASTGTVLSEAWQTINEKYPVKLE